MKLEYVSVIILSVTVFWLRTGAASAGPLSMDAVKSQYRQETGKDWEQATADEKKEFLNILESQKETNSTYFEKRGRLQELKDMSALKERAPYDVRKSFENEMGISWEDATEEQREQFQRDYDLLMKDIEREQRNHDRELRLQEREVRRETNAEKREMMLSDKKKNRDKKLALDEERRKRAEEKRKLRNAKEKRNALLRELKDKMERKK